MERKKRVRSYYEQEYIKFCREKNCDESILDFKYRKQIGWGGFTPDMYDWDNFDADEIQLFEEQQRIKKSPSSFSINLSQKITATGELFKACDRIIWFLNHSFGEFVVIKIPIDSIDTFAICIQGYIDDGWDNGCQLLEVYDASGNLIGSAYLPCEDEITEAWKWQEQVIKGGDFYSPAPEW